jgi:hypothetical protein
MEDDRQLFCRNQRYGLCVADVRDAGSSRALSLCVLGRPHQPRRVFSFFTVVVAADVFGLALNLRGMPGAAYAL